MTKYSEICQKMSNVSGNIRLHLITLVKPGSGRSFNETLHFELIVFM